jgi:hypothetical protein
MEMQFVSRQYIVNHILDKIASGVNVSESEMNLLTDISKDLFNINDDEVE